MSDDRTLLERQMQRVELRPFTLDGFHRRRNRRQRNRRIGAAVVALTVAAVAIGGLLRAISSGQVPAEEPAPTPIDLGIFEPIAGRIVSGIWAVDPIAVDPSAPSRSTSVRLGPEEVLTLGWSSDGTDLLLMRKDQTDRTFPYGDHLYVLHADGTETQLNEDAMEIDGATIAPDGSNVVFGVVDDGLFVVEAEGGRPVRIAEEGRSPTFSPDGTQIAYVVNGAVSGEAHLWVADADGSDAHEILVYEPALVADVDSLVWSPAGDRLAMGIDPAGPVAIYTVAPDGSDLTKVISGGINPFWSPDGSQIAYTRPYDGPRPGLAIADADGSNVREYGFGGSGPWHPGAIREGAETPASPSPSTSPEPSSATGATNFASTIHGISIDPPSGWETRPATESWAGEPLDFDSPAADVLFDPALGEGLYLIVASQPYGDLSQDEWRDQAVDWLCTGEGIGGAFGSWTVDGADAFVLTCGSTASAALIFTDGSGYLIRLVVSSEEPGLADTYDWDWHKVVLETVDLRPEEALDAPSPTPSP